jgi:2-polyprenyl-3-methyl-5-hydroxy-6-metoxy-1,4-benzoquinol methylase
MSKKCTYSIEDLIVAAYGAVLGRKPDVLGFDNARHAIEAGLTYEDFLKEMLNSEEFNKKEDLEVLRQSVSYQLDTLYDPFEVEFEASDEELDRIVSHIENEWSEYGKSDVYWSVMTSEKYSSKNLTAESISEFYDSGKDTMRQIEVTLRRCQEIWRGSAWVGGKCLEYGCGVGRVTFQLAKAFRTVTGLDISPGHLVIAEKRAKDLSINNISFKKLSKLKELESYGNYDFIFSVIVLQHNPPPIMMQILRFFFQHLEKDGIVMFQIPVQKKEYKFKIDDYLLGINNNKGMEMHMLPQEVILKLAYDHNCFPIEIHNDGWTGEHSQYVSQTFVLKKIEK